jgi:hypothetical protein
MTIFNKTAQPIIHIEVKKVSHAHPLSVRLWQTGFAIRYKKRKGLK